MWEHLGYEGKAAGIRQGEAVSFSFENCRADSVEVELRFLPTHPINGKDLRIRVEVDGQPSDIISYRTYGRSEEWKQNILSNQAVRRITFPLGKSTSHRLTVHAIDEGILLDQVYLYAKQ